MKTSWPGRSIVCISFFSPSRGHAGGLRIMDLYANIRRMRPDTRLILITCVNDEGDWRLKNRNDIFDEVHRVPSNVFKSHAVDFQKIGKDGDLIDLQYHQSGAFIDAIRKNYPNSKIIFNPLESQIRAFMIVGKKFFKNMSLKEILGFFLSAIQEFVYGCRVDRVGCVSIADFNALKIFLPSRKLFVVETGYSEFEISNQSLRTQNFDLSGKGKTPRLIFLAYFGSKTNREALKWFCKYVHPLIARQVDNYELSVVGRGLNEAIRLDCANKAINWIGEVENIADIISSSTAGIAPALSGAGVRGKIHQYASLGVPCVASTISAISLKYVNATSIFLADSPIDFSKRCVDLLTDEKLARTMGEQAKKICLSEYSWASIEPDIRKLYSLD